MYRNVAVLMGSLLVMSSAVVQPQDVVFYVGDVNDIGKTGGNIFVWPVRGGQ